MRSRSDTDNSFSEGRFLMLLSEIENKFLLLTFFVCSLSPNLRGRGNLCYGRKISHATESF